MICKSYAKINLALDVIKKREDNYHELSMIMQSIGLYDTLTINKTDKAGINLSSDKPYLPTDSKNVAYKATELFFQRAEIKCGIDIFIEKNIPVGAGLGGGSSNAAAVLLALNDIFGQPIKHEELIELGKTAGADVPFCMLGGCAHAGGIGEKLTSINSALNVTYVLVKPKLSISTSEVYQGLDISQIDSRPDIDEVISGITAGDIRKISANTANVLESVVLKRHPGIEKLKIKMKNFGAKIALMSGSGSTVFGMFTDKHKAYKAYEYFEGTEDFAWLGRAESNEQLKPSFSAQF